MKFAILARLASRLAGWAQIVREWLATGGRMRLVGTFGRPDEVPILVVVVVACLYAWLVWYQPGRMYLP